MSGPAEREDSRTSTLPPPPQTLTRKIEETRKSTVSSTRSRGPQSRFPQGNEVINTEGTKQSHQLRKAEGPSGMLDDEKDDPPRDQGVSDETWHKLGNDKRTARQRYTQLITSRHIVQTLTGKAQDAQHKIAEGDDVDRWRQELTNVKMKLADQMRELQRREEEEREEQRLQSMLMGLCPVGYRWIKQADGYRCAGGSHFKSFAQLRNEGIWS